MRLSATQGWAASAEDTMSSNNLNIVACLPAEAESSCSCMAVCCCQPTASLRCSKHPTPGTLYSSTNHQLLLRMSNTHSREGHDAYTHIAAAFNAHGSVQLHVRMCVIT